VGQVARPHGERVQSGGEAAASLLTPEIRREGLDGAVVDAEVPVRVTARGEQEERAPARLVQLDVGEADSVARDVGEDGVGVAELASLEAREEIFERVHSCMIA
jgi:predicted membrane GTPase involved in stress response